MTRSNLFKSAHKLARSFEGNYLACFTLALNQILDGVDGVDVDVDDADVDGDDDVVVDVDGVDGGVLFSNPHYKFIFNIDRRSIKNPLSKKNKGFFYQFMNLLCYILTHVENYTFFHPPPQYLFLAIE
ncbi:MAG: hypothetical protein Q9M50_14255 [Methylococcales bacterium]|nr:hypothetical protein [Methylococcales bacterium]